ncbi:MAG: TonB-dependent receptor, partial [Alphaproteobacteria bacterium]|nr:TonB-dependent receptor [Alphaproteobacteria bacterium]
MFKMLPSPHHSLRRPARARLWVLTALVAVPAAAQTPAVPPETVSVSGERAQTTIAIDRKIYTTSSFVQALSGSVNDVLRDLPSVTVDASGNVLLRGDASVEILIDGKPSTTMSPSNRAAALQQMPANSIDSIEVITNPSAEFKPDGPAGIINIVTKKVRTPGVTGTLQAAAGSEGRANGSGAIAYKTGKWTLNANASMRHETRPRLTVDDRILIGPTGNSSSLQNLANRVERTSVTAFGGADYDLDPLSRLSGSFSWSRRMDRPSSFESDLLRNPAGALLSDFDRSGSGDGHQVSSQAILGYRHTFDNSGLLTLDLRRGETSDTQNRRYDYLYRTPPTARVPDEQILALDLMRSEFTAEYSQPFSALAKLKTGYDLEYDVTNFNNYGGTIVGAAHISDPAQTNHFVYILNTHAIYGTYDFPFEDWSISAGLRLEDTIIRTNQITSSLKGSNSYTGAYPTLHVQREVGDSQAIHFSYSHRVARPGADVLNPYLVYNTAFTARAGNPNLKPAQTHSFEAGYEAKAFGADLSATAYWRATHDGITDFTTYLTPSVLLATRANLGKSVAGGLELAAGGKLWADLAYNLSGNLYYNEVEAPGLGTPRRVLDTYDFKASLDYTLGPDDLVQLSGNYGGKRLLQQQGYILPAGTLNFGYRHK